MPYCIICGNEFTGKHSLQKACSPECSKELHQRSQKQCYQNAIKIRREVSKKYNREHKEQCAKYKRERNEQFKLQVLNHYGQVCACCGESHREFLTVDHIGGEGNKHRKNLGFVRTSEWLARNNFPEGFQILCMNCNYLKGNEKIKFCKVHHPELYEIHS